MDPQPSWRLHECLGLTIVGGKATSGISSGIYSGMRIVRQGGSPRMPMAPAGACKLLCSHTEPKITVSIEGYVCIRKGISEPVFHIDYCTRSCPSIDRLAQDPITMETNTQRSCPRPPPSAGREASAAG